MEGGAPERRGVLAQRETTLQHEIGPSSQVTAERQQQQKGLTGLGCEETLFREPARLQEDPSCDQGLLTVAWAGS